MLRLNFALSLHLAYDCLLIHTAAHRLSHRAISFAPIYYALKLCHVGGIRNLYTHFMREILYAAEYLNL